MKKTAANLGKLRVQRETVRVLGEGQLSLVGGATGSIDNGNWSCCHTGQDGCTTVTTVVG
ncbi:MAG TPA: hypothetical protein VE075_01895 [Thermoanaerobaculia bacterium]|nr:hypothetical protein [Thermoanaerobaculia bacterium]